MKHPIIIETGSVWRNWEGAKEAQDNVIDDSGNVNWGAAMMSDPGVIACPGCDVCLWNEGKRIRCPDCGHEWDNPGCR